MISYERPNVDIGDVDGELVAVLRCVCGTEHPSWTVMISIYPSDPTIMPCCGRRLYFRQQLSVYEVVELAYIQ